MLLAKQANWMLLKFVSRRPIHRGFVLRQPFSFRADPSGAAEGFNTNGLPQEQKGVIKSFHQQAERQDPSSRGEPREHMSW